MSVANWLEYDRFAVYGLGRSGLAACRLLDRHGKDVLASDTASREELEETLEQLPGSVDVRLGENTPGGAEAVVLSPGLSPSTPAVDDLRGGDLPVLSEVDLAADASPAEIAAITGTDGKSTTTSMVGHIAAASGRAHEVAGNIGTPLSTVADGVGTEALLIAEISAFQLWSSRHLSPSVAAFTNVADDHLDYFDGDRDAYRRAKRRLADLCEASAIGVFNLEDDTVRSWAAEFSGARVGYGFERPDEAWDGAVWCEAGVIHWSPPGRGASSDVIAVDALPVSGRHNQLNAMCAAGVAMGANMDRGAVREGLSEFDALSHRLEFVNCVDGVEFYDDSKATNVNSAVAGLRSLEPPLVVVAGGVDKGLDFGPFARTVAERARAAVLIGESRERIAASIRDQSSDGFRIDFADTLPGATRRAARLARRAPAGTDVVLSPACSSFDMFESYADRGDHFQEAVAQLAANGES